MSRAPSEHMIDRLRRNLADAGVPADEADIQGIVEKGFLSRLGDVEQVLERAPADGAPDYLHAWGGAGQIEQVSSRAQQPIESAQGQQPDTSIMAIAAQIRARQISPVELTELALARIAERDPLLNAFQ